MSQPSMSDYADICRPPSVADAVLGELSAAAARLDAALDYCERPLAAKSCISNAIGRLNMAATLAPDYALRINVLMIRLRNCLDCVGWFPSATVKTVIDEITEIERQLRGE